KHPGNLLYHIRCTAYDPNRETNSFTIHFPVNDQTVVLLSCRKKMHTDRQTQTDRHTHTDTHTHTQTHTHKHTHINTHTQNTTQTHRAVLASAQQTQPLPQTLSVLESTPQVRGLHTIIRSDYTSLSPASFLSFSLHLLLQISPQLLFN